MYVQLYYNDDEQEDNKLWLEHPKSDRIIDCVAIDITMQCDKRNQALEKARRKVVINSSYDFDECYQPDIEPKVTDNVYVAGFPFGYSSTHSNGYYPVWSKGSIASEYNVTLMVPLTTCLENYQNAKAFLIDARTRKGQSGSPVITNSQAPILLGIYSGRTNKESDLGYVWKIELIIAVIEQH